MVHPTKIQMPVAASSRSNFTLNIPHVTTSNFMEFGVSLARELVIDQSVDISHECFTRLEALSVPTFGEAQIKHRAFYVPFRTVFPAFLDFKEGVPHVYNNGESSIPQYVPVLYDDTITSMFLNTNGERFTDILAEDDTSVADFTVEIDNSLRKVRLTPLGRRVYKMFIALGMKFTFTLSSTHLQSALPLMCACRVYLDWFYTSQYAHTDGYTAIQKHLIKNDDVVDIGESFCTAEELKVIMMTISSVFYEPDYYTAAWDNPTGPNQGLQSGVNIPDITGAEISSGNKMSVTNQRSKTGAAAVVSTGSFGIESLSSYMLTAVKKLADYMKRNQLAGARAFDRILARYGKQIPAEALNRSYLIGESNQFIQFGDVTSLSNTYNEETGTGSPLGDYAGKGISFGNGNFNYTASEPGYLIVVSTITPVTYYYQGVDRMTKHISRLDFFTPEFDALGVQAISKSEVFKPLDAVQFQDYFELDYDNELFGFVPRYGEYKMANAILSGDYALRSLNTGKDAWTLFRDVSPLPGDTLADIVHDFAFVSARDANQYNRIFFNTSENADHFNIIHKFVIKTSFPGKSLYDTYEFDDEDKSKNVTMGLGGTQLN